MVSPAAMVMATAMAKGGGVGPARLSPLRASGNPDGGAPRSSIRYRSVKSPRGPLRRRVGEVSEARTSRGYRQVHAIFDGRDGR